MKMSKKSFAGRLLILIPYFVVTITEVFSNWLSDKSEDLGRYCYNMRNSMNAYADKKFPLKQK